MIFQKSTEKGRWHGSTREGHPGFFLPARETIRITEEIIIKILKGVG
jgi:hypothetical protein